jgi:putative phosphonate catabolism associated alcohol dehydrogenase
MTADRDTASTARVQVFDGPGRPLRLESWPVPRTLGECQVLIRIELATICGSDLHTVTGRRSEPTPCILGHEAIGRVVRAHQARTTLRPGDRVTWTIADSCGSCPPCSEHRLPQKCRALFKYGHAPVSDGTGLNGCYASHIVLRQGTHIVRVPDALSDRVAAPANCALATAVNAVSRIPAGCSSAVVQGAGLLGLYMCALLGEQGVENVFCVDIQEHRLAQVESFGAIPIDGRPERYALDRERILAKSPHGVDVVLEAAGAVSLIPEGVRLLRAGGSYVFVGLVHPQSQLDLTGEQVIRRCLTISGIHNYAPWHLDEAVRFLVQAGSRYPFADLVSPPLPLTDLEKALQMAETQRWHRVSIRPQRES